MRPFSIHCMEYHFFFSPEITKMKKKKNTKQSLLQQYVISFWRKHWTQWLWPKIPLLNQVLPYWNERSITRVLCVCILSHSRNFNEIEANEMDHESKIYENVSLEFYIFSRKCWWFSVAVCVCVFVRRLLIDASVYALLTFQLCDALISSAVYFWCSFLPSLSFPSSVALFIILTITIQVFSALRSKPIQFSNFASNFLVYFFALCQANLVHSKRLLMLWMHFVCFALFHLLFLVLFSLYVIFSGMFL